MKHEGHSAGRELYVATSAICNRAVTVMVLANHNRAFGLYLPAPLQRVAYLSLKVRGFRGRIGIAEFAAEPVSKIPSEQEREK